VIPQHPRLWECCAVVGHIVKEGHFLCKPLTYTF
jgi:hypothetical protein